MKTDKKQWFFCGAVTVIFYIADAFGVTITQPGVYRLSADINGTVIIAANNVTLDLNSKTIMVLVLAFLALIKPISLFKMVFYKIILNIF